MILDSVYANAPYETRLRAPALWTLGFVLLFAALAGALNSLLFTADGLSSGIILLFIGTIQIIVLTLIRRGRYEAGSTLMTLSMAIGLGGNTWISGYTGPTTFLTAAMTSALVYFICLAFLQNRRVLSGIVIGMAVNWALSVAFIVLAGSVTEQGEASLVSDIAVSAISLAVCAVMALRVQSLFRLLLADFSRELDESKANESRLLDLARAASDQLGKTIGLQTVIEETAASSHQIERNIAGIAAKLEKVEDEFESSRSALERIETRLGALTGNAQSQSSHIAETSAAISQMVANIESVGKVLGSRVAAVEELAGKAVAGHEVLDETVESFRKVLSGIDSIREMTDFISGVAGQTNLLAMNAAIEAAHAGDAGRGFAVVADEVRKLAESSSQNAGQISQTLSQLLEAITATGANVNRTGLSFEEIRHGIQSVKDAMEEISSSVRELSQGSGEILSSTASMNDITQEVFRGIQDLSRESAQVQSGISSLGDILNETVGGMQEIKQGTMDIRNAMVSVQELGQGLVAQGRALEEAGGKTGGSR